MSKLILMMGTPGSGKSTYIKNNINWDNDTWISRDAIRFSMVEEHAEYFSKEKEVFNEFVKEIIFWLDKGYNVYADATHLNRGSRSKLLRSIPKIYNSLEIIWVRVPINTALAQNELRKDTRSYVPIDVIKDMDSKIQQPRFDEGFDRIIIAEPHKTTILEEKNL